MQLLRNEYDTEVSFKGYPSNSVHKGVRLIIPTSVFIDCITVQALNRLGDCLSLLVLLDPP